jgi:hypothetical protein
MELEEIVVTTSAWHLFRKPVLPGIKSRAGFFGIMLSTVTPTILVAPTILAKTDFTILPGEF